MLNLERLFINPLLVAGVGSLIAIGASQAFAETPEPPTDTPRVYVDPETGEATQITKFPSEMTDEEMASYSEEELKNLKAIEEKIKVQLQSNN